MVNINWAKLVHEGRVKFSGIPWNKEEAKAVFENEVDPDIVRAGFLTFEEFEAAKISAEIDPDKYAPKKLKLMRKAELIVLAKELKIDFDSEVVTNNDLRAEIAAKAEKMAVPKTLSSAEGTNKPSEENAK